MFWVYACVCFPHPRTYVHPSPPRPIVHKLYRLINTPHTPNSAAFEDPKCCFTCFLSFRFSYFRLIAFPLEWNTPASKPKSWGYPVQALCVLAWEDRLLGVCTYESALTLTQMNPEPCSLNYVKVSSKCCFRGLSKLLNSCECQTLFLNRVGHCQVCNVYVVFCSLTSKDRRGDGGLAQGTSEFYF